MYVCAQNVEGVLLFILSTRNFLGTPQFERQKNWNGHKYNTIISIILIYTFQWAKS